MERVDSGRVEPGNQAIMDNNRHTEESEENINENSQATTDECPPPPAYYEFFEDEGTVSKVSPPSLDSISIPHGKTLMDTVQNNVYGGLIEGLQKRYKYNLDVNYYRSLKEQVNNVLSSCMELVSDIPPKRSIDESTNDIQASLETIQHLLAEYRHHEARSNLIKLRDTQIEELKKVHQAISKVSNQAGL